MRAARETRYRASDDFVYRSIAGEAILVPTGAAARRLNGIVTLTETGAFLWTRLADGAYTADDLTDALMAEYECDAADVRGDVEAFLDKGVKNRMVFSER